MRKRSRAIYIVPNVITISALCSGYYSIISTFAQAYEQAALAIFVAIVLDLFDGRVARLTRSTSTFGAELDSLADLCSFGVATSLLVYQWVLSTLTDQNLSGLVFGVAFFYCTCTALRLARFNVDSGQDRQFFRGLSSPVAALVLAGTVFLSERIGYSGALLTWLMLGFTVLVSLLMVSSYSYFSFKAGLPLKSLRSAILLLLLLLVCMGLFGPMWVLLTLTIAYVLSGPLLYIWRRFFRSKRVR